MNRPFGRNSPEREKPEAKGTSAEKAAKMMKVSDFSVKAADRVKKHGVPQLVDAVAAGKVSVSAAARIARLTPEQQQAVVAGIESGLKPKQALARVKDPLASDQAAGVDDDGRPLPEAVIPAFRQRQELRALCRRMETLGRAVKRLTASPIGVHLNGQRVLMSLDAAQQTLWAAQPARLCPHGAAEAVRCELCGGHGWLPAGLGTGQACQRAVRDR
jgi:hypothetical protein